MQLVRQNFTAGEISPRMAARFDMKKYHNSCKTLLNAYSLPHGPVMRRPGFEYIAEAKDSSKEVRLVSFEFSEEQAYIIEFGNLYCRFYKDGGQIQKTTADAWVTSTAYTVDDYVSVSSVIYRCIVDHTSGAFETDLAAAKWVATEIYEITTTYTEAELFELKFAQSADKLFICHVDHAPATLTRTGHTAWTLADISFTSPPSSWGANDYPSCVSFYEQRLCFAANDSNPQTIWMSKSADYYDFGISSPLVDDDACTYTISSDQVNVIKWMSPAGVLAIGTTGGEWILSGGANDVVTPTSIKVVRQSTHGSQSLHPVMIGAVHLFLQKPGKTVREFRYSYEQDAYDSIDLSVISEHLTRSNTITSWAYQQSPNSILWSVRDDGVLLGLTYLRQHEVVGWHRHTTDGEFESIAVIPGSTEDEVWTIVKRTVDDTVVRYIERLSTEFNPSSTDPTDGFYVDSGLTYSGASTTSISGLDHLEGEEVVILGDGAVQPSKTVASGAITLQNAVTKAHIGLAYNSDVEPMPIELVSDDATSMGRVKSVVAANVSFVDSQTLTIGVDFDNLRNIPFRKTSDNIGEYVPLFTGIKRQTLNGGYENEATVCMRQSTPLPMTIRGVTYEVEVK